MEKCKGLIGYDLTKWLCVNTAKMKVSVDKIEYAQGALSFRQTIVKTIQSMEASVRLVYL